MTHFEATGPIPTRSTQILNPLEAVRRTIPHPPFLTR